MKSAILLTTLCLLTTFAAKAQEVISTSGETFTNTQNSLEFTIGEVATSSYGSPTILSEGFHQPVIIVSNLNEKALSNVELELYPNPSLHSINLVYEGEEILELQLMDLNAKLLLKKRIIKGKNEVKLSHLVSGIYIANVIQQNKVLKSYKINKIE